MDRNFAFYGVLAVLVWPSLDLIKIYSRYASDLCDLILRYMSSLNRLNAWDPLLFCYQVFSRGNCVLLKKQGVDIKGGMIISVSDFCSTIWSMYTDSRSLLIPECKVFFLTSHIHNISFDTFLWRLHISSLNRLDGEVVPVIWKIRENSR